MYQELLRQVEDQARKYGRALQPPCDERRLVKLRECVRNELRSELPEAYAGFLRSTDGMNWNGLFVYASERSPLASHVDGFVGANLDYREDDRFADLLVFGHDSLDVYTRRVSTGEYQVFDGVAHNLIATLPSFDALMSAALRRCLP